MTKLELLNAFLNDRLTAAAEEIFRAVKDTVLEYQSELLRSKEENERLRRLLSAAVQRLLLLQPEPHSVQPHDDAPPCDSEWRGAVELQTRIKEEPTITDIHTNGSQEAGDPQERDVEVETLRRSHSPLGLSVCSRQDVSPSPRTPREVKQEDGGEDSRTQRSDTGFSSCGTVLSPCRTQRMEQQGRGLLLRSNGKAGAQILQKKNARPLKPPPPRSSSSSSSSSHPSQGIQRWHSCKECGKGFSFACQLEVHMRWHTKEKPYSCAVCRKSFTTVSMLKRHHRIHTGEKPFRCHVCGKCFNQSAHLNTHFRLHTRERAGWGRATHSKST